MGRLGLMMLAAVLLGPLVAGDVVITVDGRRFEGEVVEEGGVYIVKTRYGKVTLQADQVAKVIPKASPQEEYKEKLAALKLDDAKWQSADEHFKLGEWCLENRLRAEARERYEMAVSLDADHEDAHKALGHVKYLGKWIPLEEKMKAEGKVLVGGRWVDKDEAEKVTSAAPRAGAGGGASRPETSAAGAFGIDANAESRYVACTKCGGRKVLIERDCMQCRGKGFCRTGAGILLCPVCRGTGKWMLICPFCGGEGRHVRGRYSLPRAHQAKLPHDGWVHCPKCNGSGILEYARCSQCVGKGYSDVKERLFLCKRCNGYGEIPHVCPFCAGKGMFRKR